MKCSHLILAVSLISFISGCSEDDPIDTIRYQWPAWSFDNGFVISEYDVNPQTKPADAPITFAVKDIEDGVDRIISVPRLAASEDIRYWVSNRVDRLVVTGHGMRVVDFDGNMVNDHVEVVENLQPNLLAFSAYTQSYFWCARDGDRTLIGVANQYDGTDLSPQSVVVLLDTTLTSEVEDITETSSGNCAVLFSDGTIILISAQGTSELYKSSPIADPAFGTERMKYLKPISGSNIDYLYVLDADGLKRINIMDQSISTLLPSDEGNLLSFDIVQDTRNILFVTSGSQVWLASENATPIQALLFEHTMASFSPDGTTIAAVGYVNGAQNSITLLQYRQ